MNLHQFRFVREAVRQNFNLTEAAKATRWTSIDAEVRKRGEQAGLS